MGRSTRAGLLAFAIWAALTAQALAAPRYAEVGGSGPAASCPEANPCSIQDAINDSSVASGDVINLLPGTYMVTSELTPDSAVTIQGAPGMVRPLIAADFTGSVGPLHAIEILHNGSVVRDLNIVMTETAVGDYFSLGLQVYNANAIVERVRMLAVGTYGSGASIGSDAGGTTVVRDSVFSSAGNYPALRTEGEAAPGLSTIKVLNVTAEATGAGIVPDALLAPEAFGNMNVIARNSIFESVNGEAVDANSSTAGGDAVVIAIDHSNTNMPPVATGGGGDSSVTIGAGNQSIAPSFVNRAAGDFRQLPTSITLDGGVTDPALGATDLDGDGRILDVRPDIGADELDVAVPRTAIRGRARRVIHRRRTRVRFFSDEPAATFECKLDRRRFRPCRTPKRLRLRPGRHRLKVRAVDAAGHRDATPAVVRIRVLLP